MTMLNQYMLGNQNLHDRLYLATGILGKLVSKAPGSLSIKDLSPDPGNRQQSLVAICRTLSRAGLLQEATDDQGTRSWVLSCQPRTTTLEDVFNAIMFDGKRKRRSPFNNRECRLIHGDAELFLMQATMNVNDALLKHLRLFTLDRFKAKDGSHTDHRFTPRFS